jgi:GntR family transcriptional regulator
MGRTVTSDVLRAVVEPLPHAACAALSLPPDTEGVVLERLRLVDDELALYVINYLPMRFADAVVHSDMGRGSLYEILEQHEGVEVFGGRRTLEAVVADDKLSRLLEVEPGSPLIYIESTSWNRSLEPFDFYCAWLRSDRIKIDVQVSSGPSG